MVRGGAGSPRGATEHSSPSASRAAANARNGRVRFAEGLTARVTEATQTTLRQKKEQTWFNTSNSAASSPQSDSLLRHRSPRLSLCDKMTTISKRHFKPRCKMIWVLFLVGNAFINFFNRCFAQFLKTGATTRLPCQRIIKCPPKMLKNTEISSVRLRTFCWMQAVVFRHNREWLTFCEGLYSRKYANVLIWAPC